MVPKCVPLRTIAIGILGAAFAMPSGGWALGLPGTGPGEIADVVERPASAADRAASAVWLEVLKEASQNNVRMLTAGVAVDPPDLLVPGELIIPERVVLVLLNVTVLGGLSIQSAGALELYGADLRFRHELFVLGPNPVFHVAGRLEAHDLYSLSLPLGLHPSLVLANRPSWIHADNPELNKKIESLTGENLLGTVAPFVLQAPPGSRIVFNNSRLGNVVTSVIVGALLVRNTLVHDSGLPFNAFNVNGHTITGSTFERVTIAYQGSASNNLRFENTVVQTAEEGVHLINSNGPTISDSTFQNIGVHGVFTQNTNNVVVSGNTFVNRNVGQAGSTVTFAGGVGAAINDNVATFRRGFFVFGTGPFQFVGNEASQTLEGVVISGPGTHTVTDNFFHDLPGFGGGFFSGSTSGISMSGGTATVARNRVLDSPFVNGIVLSGVPTTVDANVVIGNWRGILQSGAGSVLRFNRAEGNTLGGIETFNANPLSVAGNVATSNRGPGIHIADSAAPAVVDNVVRGNGFGNPAVLRGGLELLRAPAVEFKNNLAEDNAFGYSIPYDSRKALLNADNNWVNGHNLDGTVDPSTQLYWIGGKGCENGLNLAGRTIDPSKGGQFRGVLNIQGSITLYDCGSQTASVTIAGAVLPNNTHGVFAWGTLSLTITSSTFANNKVPYFRGLNTPTPPQFFPIFSGGIFVEGTIPLLVTGSSISGAEAGMNVRNSVGDVTNNNVQTSGTGIAGKASNSVFNDNVLHRNGVGIDLEKNAVTVSSNNVTENTLVGILLRSASPIVEANFVSQNGPGPGGAGILLIGSSPEIRSSTIQGSDQGIAMTGSGPVLQNLLIQHNRVGVGASGQSTPFLVDSTLIDNDAGVQGSSSGVTVLNTTFNGTHGLVMLGGSFNIQRSLIAGGLDGLSLQSASGEMKNTTLTGLVVAVVMSGSSVTFIQCDIVDNFFAGNASQFSSGTINLCNIKNNAAGGLQFSTGTQMTVRDSNIEGNANYGAKNNDGTVTIDARQNWWGAATGPNTAGADQTVGNVFVNPWLGAPKVGAGVQP